MTDHLDSDAVLLAAEACRRYIEKHGAEHPNGIRASDLVDRVHTRMRPLSSSERFRVQVLLAKMPMLACKVHCAERGQQNALRYWRVDCAPLDAFSIGHAQLHKLGE